MSNLRIAYTGGAAIGPDLYKFYRSLGINLKQLYGQTETAAYVCKQETIGAEAEHVGKPLPGVEVKIADNKEILIKLLVFLKNTISFQMNTLRLLTITTFLKQVTQVSR